MAKDQATQGEEDSQDLTMLMAQKAAQVGLQETHTSGGGSRATGGSDLSKQKEQGNRGE